MAWIRLSRAYKTESYILLLSVNTYIYIYIIYIYISTYIYTYVIITTY